MDVPIPAIPAPSAEEAIPVDCNNEPGNEEEDIHPDNTLSQVKPTELQEYPVAEGTPPEAPPAKRWS
ncbi:hypothetical protein O181_027579 [Austropuccinia psidii MF-1]|uniref:Uncharacterized protein n=1 Tax=Austropuccinia psidii MF-1 TaxID=1389203 RepID=A0A9Q3CP93_9BASI|nr:hypothetical protein [Austropuccinia psidii MF-1]